MVQCDNMDQSFLNLKSFLLLMDMTLSCSIVTNSVHTYHISLCGFHTDSVFPSNSSSHLLSGFEQIPHVIIHITSEISTILIQLLKIVCPCAYQATIFCPQDRANQLFKQVHEQKSLKGRSNDAIASACLYIACRQEGVPRTFKGKSLLHLNMKHVC